MGIGERPGVLRMLMEGTHGETARQWSVIQSFKDKGGSINSVQKLTPSLESDSCKVYCSGRFCGQVQSYNHI